MFENLFESINVYRIFRVNRVKEKDFYKKWRSIFLKMEAMDWVENTVFHHLMKILIEKSIRYQKGLGRFFFLFLQPTNDLGNWFDQFTRDIVPFFC